MWYSSTSTLPSPFKCTAGSSRSSAARSVPDSVVSFTKKLSTCCPPSMWISSTFPVFRPGSGVALAPGSRSLWKGTTPSSGRKGSGSSVSVASCCRGASDGGEEAGAACIPAAKSRASPPCSLAHCCTYPAAHHRHTAAEATTIRFFKNFPSLCIRSPCACRAALSKKSSIPVKKTSLRRFRGFESRLPARSVAGCAPPGRSSP